MDCCRVALCSLARSSVVLALVHPPPSLARAPSLYRPSLALSAVCLSFCHSLAPSSGLQFDTPFRAEERIEGGRRSTTTRSLHSPPLPPLALLRFSPVRHVRHVGALRSRPFSVFQRPSRSSSLSILSESLLPSLAAIGKRPAAMRPRRGVLAPSSAGERRRFTFASPPDKTTADDDRVGESREPIVRRRVPEA